jgi:DNA repair protein REV1
LFGDWQELKEIMLNNGGRFVNYFSRHTVTHIICTHLPESKMRNMRYRSGEGK